MVTYVQNKLKKVTIIVNISVSKALFIRTLCWKHAVATFFKIQTQIVFSKNFMGGLCVVYVWLGQASVNENTANLERVLYLCPQMNGIVSAYAHWFSIQGQ